LIISRKGNCDHDASLRVMMCRQIFIIWPWKKVNILDFKLAPCSECFMLSSG
jgi:hypothetical protein